MGLIDCAQTCMCFKAVKHLQPTVSVAQLDTCPTGGHEFADSTPAGSATFFHGELIMKYFLRSFSALC